MQEYLVQYLFLCLSLATTFFLPVLLAYGWQALGRVRDERIRAYANLVVSAAQQAIPDKSDRYGYAAEALAKQFPGLDKKRVAELIEASVLAVKNSGPAEPAKYDGMTLRKETPYTVSDIDLSADPNDTKTV